MTPEEKVKRFHARKSVEFQVMNLLNEMASESDLTTAELLLALNAVSTSLLEQKVKEELT